MTTMMARPHVATITITTKEGKWVISDDVQDGTVVEHDERDVAMAVNLAAEWIRECVDPANGKPWEFVVMRDGEDVTSQFRGVLG